MVDDGYGIRHRNEALGVREGESDSTRMMGGAVLGILVAIAIAIGLLLGYIVHA